MHSIRPICTLILVTLLLSGCTAGRTAFSKAQKLEAEGNLDAALVKYAEVATKHPEVGEYRVGLYTYFTSPNCPFEHEGWPQPADAEERAYVGFQMRLTTISAGSTLPVAATVDGGWVGFRPPTRR